MSWDRDSVEEAGETVGFGGTLWILYLAQSNAVSPAKTSDYHTLKSSIRSYAKQQEGLDDPGEPPIREGYQNITRRVVVDADGNRGYINKQDKQDLVRLTSLGYDLTTTIDRDERIEKALKETIDIEIEEPQDPWWPGQGPNESFAIHLRTYADRTVLDEETAEIEALASFECDRCDTEIEHEYDVRLEEGNPVEWGRTVEVECPQCEQEYGHGAVHPHRDPEPLL